MNNRSTKKGFTLVELLIATAVFAIFLTSIVTLLVDIYRSSRRITLEEQIYEDERILVKQISQMLERNTIDYEEYYRAAVGGKYFTKDTDPNTYTYGDYQKGFYDFGSGGTGPKGEGALCNDGSDPALNPGCVINKTTIDRNTGRNPTSDKIGTMDQANAFCVFGSCPADLTALHKQNQLYLINKEGDKKTILSLEPVQKDVDGTTYNEKTLSMAWFYGTDTDSDDVPETWTIGNEINNTGGDDGLVKDLSVTKDVSSVYENFIPISPLRTNIVDLQFYVTPLEDPYKAFAEIDPAVGTMIQPHITIVMTVEPSASELTNYLGPVPRQTIQTTVYSHVIQEVRSY